MTLSVAPDDIVQRHADVASDARAPLLVLEPLGEFLDDHGLGSGGIEELAQRLEDEQRRARVGRHVRVALDDVIGRNR